MRVELIFMIKDLQHITAPKVLYFDSRNLSLLQFRFGGSNAKIIQDIDIENLIIILFWKQVFREKNQLLMIDQQFLEKLDLKFKPFFYILLLTVFS